MRIIKESQNFIIVEKPANLPTTKEGDNQESLEEKIKEIFSYLANLPRAGICHRLDKDTSGLILIAKNQKALKHFQNQFKKRQINKKYLALVRGEIKENYMELKDWLIQDSNSIKVKATFPLDPEAKGKQKIREAISKLKVKERFKDYTLIEVKTLTGRKHQIRVQLASRGFPIFGDLLYGGKMAKEERKVLNRHFLHCSYLKFCDLDGKEKEFKVPLPLDLRLLLNKIQKSKT